MVSRLLPTYFLKPHLTAPNTPKKDGKSDNFLKLKDPKEKGK